MREQEMRRRVFQFLSNRMRNMIMPATVGIGLTVGACSESHAIYSAPNLGDAAAHMQSDAPAAKQDVAPGPDLALSTSDGADLADHAGTDAPDSAQAADQVLSEAGLAEVGASDAGKDLGGMKYIAPFLDAAPLDADSEAGSVIAKYVAPMPDAGSELGPITRYMGQQPDASRDSPVGVLYMAQLPS